MLKLTDWFDFKYTVLYYKHTIYKEKNTER